MFSLRAINQLKPQLGQGNTALRYVPEQVKYNHIFTVVTYVREFLPNIKVSFIASLRSGTSALWVLLQPEQQLLNTKLFIVQPKVRGTQKQQINMILSYGKQTTSEMDRLTELLPNAFTTAD